MKILIFMYSGGDIMELHSCSLQAQLLYRAHYNKKNPNKVVEFFYLNFIVI